jgi:transglutaminase-like putative cysteine protease
MRKNIIDEEKLKRQLEIVHPVIPPSKQSRYQLYVTPDDSAVEALAEPIDRVKEAYREAVQWIWVSDQTLHNESEKWLMPHEFLSDTPNYPSNPLKGNAVSDCEEQANTLVSLLRAEGINPEEVRVVLGKVKFEDGVGGHAWVELWHNGEWLPLEATSGPYWDDEEGKLVTKGGTPFAYYANHDYPVIEVWAYYNDIYYLDPRTHSGNAPDSWS